MRNRTICLWMVTSVLALTAYAAGGGILGLVSPAGAGHAVTVHSAPDGSGAGEWEIRDNEDGCHNATLTITLSAPEGETEPLCVSDCTATPAGYDYCCTALSGWCKAWYRQVSRKVPPDEGPIEPGESPAGER